MPFRGLSKTGLSIDAPTARRLLRLPKNPNGLPNSLVVKRFAENDDVTMRDTDRWILDFTTFPNLDDAVMFEQPFKLVEQVKGARASRTIGAATENSKLDKYWLMQRPRPELRKAIAPLSRVIAVPETSEHRLFRFLDARFVYSGSLFVIARDDDVTFGCLHSRAHDLWATGRGNRMGAGNQRRYNATRTFETFPFPEGLTPDIDPVEFVKNHHAIAIAKAARKLDDLREAWLNPSEKIKVVPEVSTGYPARTVPVDAEAATFLKQRTLTALYNEMPPMLALPHRKLDDAVFDAYNWPRDLSDDEILDRLSQLNKARGIGQE